MTEGASRLVEEQACGGSSEAPSPAARPVASRGPEEADSYPAVIVSLNDRWRVIECRDGMQWILQQRKGQRNGQAVWRARRYHRGRGALLASMRELCGEVIKSALAEVLLLPRRKE
jgi:hypothetical protein